MLLKNFNIVTILFILFLSTLVINQSIAQSDYSQTKPTSNSICLKADHTITDEIRLDLISDETIILAKEYLHIAYGHTSHGSQIITGMDSLPEFKEGQGGTIGLYDWNEGGSDGALDIDDYFVDGDLGNPDFITWANRTRTYLDDVDNSHVNVVMWSWCGQVSSASEIDIDTYLSLMTELEEDFPNVLFVYMTGHTDGSGYDGNLHKRNDQIRNYCYENEKILYDFEDIECFDPDGTDFGLLNVTDECYYDSNDDGNPDSANWAIEWQDANPGEWYDCSPAHTQPLNGNLKAYAAWWLWVQLGSYLNGTTLPTHTPSNTSSFSLGSFTILNSVICLSIILFGILIIIRKK